MPLGTLVKQKRRVVVPYGDTQRRLLKKNRALDEKLDQRRQPRPQPRAGGQAANLAAEEKTASRPQGTL